MRFLSPFFWLCLLLFVLNQIMERMGYLFSWLPSYLDDVLAGPIVLGFALFIQQQFTFRNRHYRFSAWHVLVYVIWYSVIFELILPIGNARHTRDWWDMLAYLAGGILFYLFGNHAAKSQLTLQKVKRRR